LVTGRKKRTFSLRDYFSVKPVCPCPQAGGDRQGGPRRDAGGPVWQTGFRTFAGASFDACRFSF